MNVLYVDNQISGGSGESLLQIVEGRRARGKSVVAFGKRGYLGPRFETASLARPPVYLPFRPWLSWGPKGRRPRAYAELARGVARQTLSLARLAAIARRESIDVVHTNCVYLVEGALVARALGLPHVWQVRELVDLDYYRFDVAKTAAMRWLDRLSDAVVCASERGARGLVELGVTREKVRVIPNMVDASSERRDLHAKLGLGPDHRLVGIVGWITPNKAVDQFVEVASRLADHDDVRFVIIGGWGHRSEYNEHVRRAIEQSPVKERILLTGVLDNAASYLHSLEVLLCPCWTESFGRTIAEAMHAGTPAVGVDSCAAAELIEDGVSGLLVSRDDVDGLAAAARRLLSNDDERRAMGRRARESVQSRFTHEVVQHRLEALYDELMARRAA